MSRTAIRLAVSAALLVLVLVLPSRPHDGWTGMVQVPVEFPVLLAILFLTGPFGRIIAVAGLTALAVLKIADLLMWSALGRAFNPVADPALIDASLRLIAGTFGRPAAIGAAMAALVLLLFIAGALWWAAGIWSRSPLSARARLAAIPVLALLALAIPLTDLGARNGSYALARAEMAQRTTADLRQLRVAAARDPFAGHRGLLGAIDRDVIVIFIESYGRTSFATRFFADTHLATLRAAETVLSGAGLSMRSGFLAAPTQGGQSWLSHSTFASGLWISDQARYHALRASGRDGLFHHARRAGFHTAAVMPAITRPWPEAQSMGFDTVLAAADLGYRGKPFNWVTMPDQFTLTAADRLLRDDRPRPPLFMQIALISSHAPWVPVPRMLPWSRIGDGREFDAMAEAGDPPRIVWKDRERVRRQYRDAIDYALQAALGYAERHAAEAPLILILGDHQAAPRIAMDDGRDVAMHVIGPEALVSRVAGWGFEPGLIPSSGAGSIPMDRMRDLILGSFSSDEAPA